MRTATSRLAPSTGFRHERGYEPVRRRSAVERHARLSRRASPRRCERSMGSDPALDDADRRRSLAVEGRRMSAHGFRAGSRTHPLPVHLPGRHFLRSAPRAIPARLAVQRDHRLRPPRRSHRCCPARPRDATVQALGSSRRIFAPTGSRGKPSAIVRLSAAVAEPLKSSSESLPPGASEHLVKPTAAVQEQLAYVGPTRASHNA